MTIEPQPADPEIDPEDDERGSPSGSWKAERPAEQDEIDADTEDT